MLPSVETKTRHGSESTHTADIEKEGAHQTVISKVSDSSSETASVSKHAPKVVGLTFLVRTRAGLTAAIRARAFLPVLVESPYGSHPDLSPYSLLIGIAGGVGITAIAPILHSHAGRAKLLWGVRTPGIVEEMRDQLSGVDKEVFIGKRMDVLEVLERECVEKEKIVVVVSGPAGMADEVRMAVNTLARSKRNLSIQLVEESFSW